MGILLFDLRGSKKCTSPSSGDLKRKIHRELREKVTRLSHEELKRRPKDINGVFIKILEERTDKC